MREYTQRNDEMAKNDVVFHYDGTNLNMILNGKSVSVPKGHKNFKAVQQALANCVPATELQRLIEGETTPPKTEVVADFAFGNIVMKDNSVSYKGEALPQKLVDHALRLRNEGFPFDGFLKF